MLSTDLTLTGSEFQKVGAAAKKDSANGSEITRVSWVSNGMFLVTVMGFQQHVCGNCRGFPTACLW